MFGLAGRSAWLATYSYIYCDRVTRRFSTLLVGLRTQGLEMSEPKLFCYNVQHNSLLSRGVSG